MNKGDGSEYKYINIVNAQGKSEVVRCVGNKAFGSADTPVYVTNEGDAAPCGFRVFHTQLSAGQQGYNFTYEHSCMIIAQRGSACIMKSYDNWNASATYFQNNAEEIEITCANKTVTINNNRVDAISVMIICD